MEMTLKEEHKKPLLGRTDMVVRIAHEGATPTRQLLREEIAKHQKKDASLVVVRRIETEFGNQVTIVDVSIYADAAHLEQFEPAHIRKRHGDDAAAAEKKEGDA